jgi:hypothetical protein
MNLLRPLAACLLCTALLPSCKKNDAVAPCGKVTVSFANEVDGQPLVLGPMNYTNAAGNKYGVDILKYYISNFTLVKADGSEKNFGTHELIDAGDPASLSFAMDSVLNGDYTSVKFLLGVDYEHNHTGDQEGDLDPIHGMIWTWNTGYTFFKHEGNFVDANGDTQPLVFHYATDRAVTAITLPISTLSIAGDARKLFLKLNLNSAYSSPNDIDFNIDNHRQSEHTEALWMDNMQANFADAFQYDHAE